MTLGNSKKQVSYSSKTTVRKEDRKVDMTLGSLYKFLVISYCLLIHMHLELFIQLGELRDLVSIAQSFLDFLFLKPLLSKKFL